MAVNHLSSVAQSSYPDPSYALFGIANSKVLTAQNLSRSAIPDAAEIKTAVFALQKESAPGPYEFSGSFFIATWHITGPLVIKAVQHFFHSNKLHKASNAYFLTLIPKTQPPSSFTDFRPISLLNFSYKIIAKILASRLSQILPSPVVTNQAAFVKGRSIHHHIALAHELIQKLHSKMRGRSLADPCVCNLTYQRLLNKLS